MRKFLRRPNLGHVQSLCNMAESCVESDPTRTWSDSKTPVFNMAARSRNRRCVLAKSVEVENAGFAGFLLDVLDGASRSNAAWKVGSTGRVVDRSLFDNYCAAREFRTSRNGPVASRACPYKLHNIGRASRGRTFTKSLSSMARTCAAREATATPATCQL